MFGDSAEGKKALLNKAVVGEITPEEAVQQYKDQFGSVSDQILSELNG